MTNTTFSIEMQGLDLPHDVKQKLQSALRSVVLSELAKTDLSQEMTVRSLPGSSERVFSHTPPILGFVVQKLGQLTQRGLADVGPSTSPGIASNLPFDGAPLSAVIEGLYYRPDIRAAIVSNSRAFAELLSRNDKAMQTFNELTNANNSTTGTERWVGIALLVLGAVVAGTTCANQSRGTIPI